MSTRQGARWRTRARPTHPPFPPFPHAPRSVTVLLFILGVIVLQLILFLAVWPTGWDFWLLP